MRIAVDARPLQKLASGGVLRFAQGIVPLLMAANRHAWLLYISEQTAQDDSRMRNGRIGVIKPIAPYLKRVSRAVWYDASLPCRAWADGAELFLTMVPRVPLAILGATHPRFLMTIHDVNELLHPDWFEPRHRWRYRLTIPIAAHRAEGIIVPSEATRRDLIRLLPVDPSRIYTIPYATSPHFRPVDRGIATDWVAEHLGLHEPFCLAVGTVYPKRNYSRLLKAFAQVVRRVDLPHRLVLVGEIQWPFWDPAVEADRLGIADRFTHLTQISDEDLRLLYGACDAVLYTSLYEGFGIPVLEGMACGAPVLTSTTSSMPEVAGNGALLVDPTSVADIADGIERLLTNDSLRAELIRRGLRRAGDFSFERTADGILAVIDQMDQSRRTRCESTTSVFKAS